MDILSLIIATCIIFGITMFMLGLIIYGIIKFFTTNKLDEINVWIKKVEEPKDKPS